MGRKGLGWLLAVLGWLSPVSAAQIPPDQLQLRRQPSLVYLRSGYRGQWQWQQRTWDTLTQTQGTGVFVHPTGQILTLATVLQATVQGIDEAKQGLLVDLARQRLMLHNEAFPQRKIPITPASLQEAVDYIRPEARLEQWERLQYVFLSGGRADQPYDFQVVKYALPENLALVTVPLNGTPTVVFGETQPPAPGTPIYALAQTYTPDKITATLYPGTWTGQGMSFPKVQGLAGALVFLTSGEVLGLAAVQGQEVRLIPNATIRQFLASAGVDNQESPVNALWQESLTYFGQAHYRRARPLLQTILERYPQHQEAHTLLTQATERIAQGQDRSPLAGWQKVLLLGGSGLVLLGAGAIGLAIWWSRRPRPVPPVQVSPTLPLPEQTSTAPLSPPPPEEVPTRLVVSAPEPTTQVITPLPQVPVTEAFRPSRLECIGGPLLGEEFTLVGTHYLGRDPQRCDIVIPDPQVSGQHACIQVADAQVILRDCGSTNGTFVNSVQSPRISQVYLQDQDVIILGQKGSVKFRFHA